MSTRVARLRLAVQAIRERDGDACCSCRHPVDFTLPASDPMAAAVVTVRPRVHGGDSARPVERIAHKGCAGNGQEKRQ